MVSQVYQVNVHDEYVLLGNAGLLRCLIPSFVSDFVLIDSWVGDDGETHFTPNTNLYGTHQPSKKLSNLCISLSRAPYFIGFNSFSYFR